MVRGFTGFLESSDPEDVMALLRAYHAAIGEIIEKYSGTLERYAGDGVMVVFNDPVPVDNPALRAVQMALETGEAMGALTGKWRELGHDVGFGISSRRWSRHMQCNTGRWLLRCHCRRMKGDCTGGGFSSSSGVSSPSLSAQPQDAR